LKVLRVTIYAGKDFDFAPNAPDNDQLLRSSQLKKSIAKTKKDLSIDENYMQHK